MNVKKAYNSQDCQVGRKLPEHQENRLAPSSLESEALRLGLLFSLICV